MWKLFFGALAASPAFRWIIIVMLAAVIFSIVYSHKMLAPLRRYTSIYLGMDEDEMLSVMGGRPNCSLLKGGRKKYEWRVNATSYSGRGGVRSYSGVRKVDIYVKDGVVEEVRPFNV